MRLPHPFVATLLVILAACAPNGRGAAPASTERAEPGVAAHASRTLTVIMRVEPPTVMEGSVDRSAIHKPLFAATLGAWDLQENPYPVLAETLPRLNSGTWRVSPDGRMETTYRLRAGLSWHDGAPLTAEDFAFTRRADLARLDWGLEQSSAEQRTMDEILAPDPFTVVIRWRAPYTEAAAPDLIPYPRHILEAVLDQGEAEAFGSHPYWNIQWVGAGPYRLDRWERGAFIEGAAFDAFALGSPRIKRVRLTWNNDPNVSLTRLLAGDADIALDGAIRFQQASILKERWSHETDGVIMLNQTTLRYIQTQARPEYVEPRALLDGRVRKAILHAIDRPTLAEAMLEDRSMVADTVPPRTAPYYAAVDRAVAKYPFDPGRAEQLMAEAGFAKARDGYYVSPSSSLPSLPGGRAEGEGGRFRFEVRGVSGGAEEQDTTIVHDYLHRAGMDGFITLLPSSARAVDDRMKGTFPGLTLNNNTLQRGLGLDKWHSSRVGKPENNWVGGNRMGWTHPEFDRLHDLWTTTLDRNQAAQHMVEMMKLLSEEMALMPLYYNFQVVAHSGALRGPQPITPDSTRYGNIHQWEWR